MTDSGSELTHPSHDSAKILSDPIRNVQPKLTRPTDPGPGPGSPDETLGRDASHVQAIPTQEMPFNQGDLRSETRGDGSGNQARGSGADDHDVVSTGRFGVDPVRRMHVIDQLSIEFIHGKNFDRGKNFHGWVYVT